MEYFDHLWRAAGDVSPELFELRRNVLLAFVARGERVIDVGCGEGWFSYALAEAGCHVRGVDVSGVAVSRARGRYPELEFDVCGEASLPGGEGEFDVAWLGEVLEHVRDGIGLLEEVARVLRPGGRLLLTTPDHGWRRRLVLGLSRRAFEAHFEPRADHLRFFTARTLASLLDACGFEDVRTRSRRGVLLVSARAAG